jgi:lysozyme
MVDRNRLTVQLMEHEGVRYLPYYDTVGKLTIGVGRNLTDVGISKDEAQYLLATDINKVIVQLDELLPWWRDLDEVRQRVLADMAFNMGIHGLLEFTTTLGMVKVGEYADAADQMLRSKWARQVGKRARRLSRMMETGLDIRLEDIK